MAGRAERGEQAVERDHEGPIADPVDDERLVAGGGVADDLVPEADQRERAEADALPSHEQQPQIVAQHQQEHREGEQVEPAEEAPVRIIVVHVAGRVDVDQAADAGDDQRHQHRERIEPERDIDIEPADMNPAPEIVEHEAILGRQRQHHHEGAERDQKGEHDHAASDHGDRTLAESLLQPGAGEKVDRRAERGQQHYPADEGDADRMVHGQARASPEREAMRVFINFSLSKYPGDISKNVATVKAAREPETLERSGLPTISKCGFVPQRNPGSALFADEASIFLPKSDGIG